MRGLARLLATIAWCFAAPFIGLADGLFVLVGLKRVVPVGRPVWRWR